MLVVVEVAVVSFLMPPPPKAADAAKRRRRLGFFCFSKSSQPVPLDRQVDPEVGRDPNRHRDPDQPTKVLADRQAVADVFRN